MSRPFFSPLAWAAVALAALPVAARAQASPTAKGLFDSIKSKISVSGILAGTSEDPQRVIGGLITGLIGLLGVIFFILILYGGYLWMTARGNEPQIEKAKAIIKSSTVGLAVVLGAYLITFIVVQLLTSQTLPPA